MGMHNGGKKGPLVVLEYPGGKEGGMNAKRYQEQVLEGALRQFYTAMESERGNVQYQQDNTPSHTAKTTKQWLESHKITVFPYLPSSPNVSPVEPIWHELKGLLRARPHHPSSVQELQVTVREAWDAISVKDIDKYVNRIDNVVAAVLKANGGHTCF